MPITRSQSKKNKNKNQQPAKHFGKSVKKDAAKSSAKKDDNKYYNIRVYGDGNSIIETKKLEIHSDKNWLENVKCGYCQKVGTFRSVWLWIPDKKGDKTSNNGKWYHSACLS